MTWTPVDPGTLNLEDHRRELVMVEEVLRQRQDFSEEVRRLFKFDDRLPRARYLFRAPSNGLYELIYIGRPSGLEFWYLANGFDQLPPKATIDGCLWVFARDVVAGVEAHDPQAASIEVLERFLPKPV